MHLKDLKSHNAKIPFPKRRLIYHVQVVHLHPHWQYEPQLPLCLGTSCISATDVTSPWKSRLLHMSHFTRNPVFRVCDQVRLKPACSATERLASLEILILASIGIMLSRQQKTKVLIRLQGCAGWSAPLLFTYGKTGFLMMQLIFIWAASWQN